MFSISALHLFDVTITPLEMRLLLGWLGFSAIMASAWLMWRLTLNAGFVDSIWSFGVGLTAVLIAFVPMADDVSELRRLVVTALVALWSARLGGHIWHRSRHKGNDPRYMKLLDEWGPAAPLRMFIFLQIQALCSLPLFLTVALAAHHPAAGFDAFDTIALILAVMAVVGEAVADEQLRRYSAHHSSHGVCDVGLWRFSRHPNYFFEFLLWCALALFAIKADGFIMSLLALAGPLCMYWLLVYVSGVPLLEEHMVATRGEMYRDYQRRTHVFFPLPPRISQSAIVSGDNIHFEHAFEQPKHQNRGEG